MFVVVTERVVKVGTGAREQFSLRAANQFRISVSGPFGSHRTAQKAVLAALATHTCIAASVLSESQVRDFQSRGHGRNGEGMQTVYDQALSAIESAK